MEISPKPLMSMMKKKKIVTEKKLQCCFCYLSSDKHSANSSIQASVFNKQNLISFSPQLNLSSHGNYGKLGLKLFSRGGWCDG